MLHGPRKDFRWGEDYPWDDNDSEWEMEKGLEILNDDFYWRERKSFAVIKPEVCIVELREELQGEEVVVDE